MRCAFPSIVLVLAGAVRTPAAYEVCCDGKDNDGDNKIDAQDSDCGDSPCICTRPNQELFFGRPGPWPPEERPQDGTLRFDDERSSTISLRARSLWGPYFLSFRIVRRFEGMDHVYSIEGPEDGVLPLFIIITDFVPGSPVHGRASNELVTPRRIVAIEPGPIFDDGFPDANLLEIGDPSDDIVGVTFHGTWERREGMISGDGLSTCGGLDLLRLELEPAAPVFRRGDANADGRSDIADAVAILSYLFLHGDRPPCDTAADVDASGSLAVTDAVRILLALFGGGPPIPAPFPDCGPRLPEDSLGCGSFDC